MKRKKNGESGLLSLEASIVLTIFIFLMLFMYSFFVVFEARNEMAHLVLSTANSLALDTYASDKMDNSNTAAKVIYSIYSITVNDDNQFTDTRKWYQTTEVDGAVVQNTAFAEVVEDRFIAYLTDGDEKKAEEILDKLNIVNGREGLDFSGSYVSGNNLYVTVSYTIEYEFNLFGLGTLKMEQSACSKLWKQGD